MLNAILYAVACDVDIVNMSLGAYLDKGGFYDDDGTWVGADEGAVFPHLVKQTINYADTQGVLIIASAGNDALNGQGDSCLVHSPSDIGATVCVSETGPIGWALDPTVSLDDVATCTNYGLQIDFAAPGGNFDPAVPYYWYDFVMNCTNGQWYAWYAGTSQAAPHVAGVAALIVEKNGGDMKPSQILRDLRQTADDLGKSRDRISISGTAVSMRHKPSPTSSLDCRCASGEDSRACICLRDFVSNQSVPTYSKYESIQSEPVNSRTAT